MFYEAQCIINITLVDVSYIFPKKFPHACLIQLLEPIHQFKMSIVSHTLPIKFKLGRIFYFIHQFT